MQIDGDLIWVLADHTYVAPVPTVEQLFAANLSIKRSKLWDSVLSVVNSESLLQARALPTVLPFVFACLTLTPPRLVLRAQKLYVSTV